MQPFHHPSTQRGTSKLQRVERPFRKACRSLREGRYEQARDLLDAVLAVDPQHYAALNLRGETCLMLKDPGGAVRAFSAAVAVEPMAPDTYIGLGNVMHQFQQYEGAVASFEIALALGRRNEHVYSGLGSALYLANRFDEAIAAHTQAIGLSPASALHYLNRATVLQKMGRLDEARDDHEKAMSIDGSHVAGSLNSGSHLYATQDFERALQAFDRAIEWRPNDHRAWCYRGVVHARMKNFAAAFSDYAQSIALNPEFAEVHYNKALLHLLLGEFEQGWALNEWRWKKPNFPSPRRNFTAPLWLGETPLTGKTILLHSEQGLGDAIQFIRYAIPVARLAARVLVEVHTPLFGLFDGLPDNVTLYCRGEPLPDFDVHCPFMSLPYALKTRVESIPPVGVSIRSHHLSTLGALQPVLHQPVKVGVVWSGNVQHSNDQARSIPFDRFLQCLEPVSQVVCLQKEIRDYDLTAMQASGKVIDLRPHLESFLDTAGIIRELDLVITVDTSVAHLAASMGKPTWLLIAHSPDYRWLLDRTDSPWYPSVRLFRQQSEADWSVPLAAVAQALQELHAMPAKVALPG